MQGLCCFDCNAPCRGRAFYMAFFLVARRQQPTSAIDKHIRGIRSRTIEEIQMARRAMHALHSKLLLWILCIKHSRVHIIHSAVNSVRWRMCITTALPRAPPLDTHHIECSALKIYARMFWCKQSLDIHAQCSQCSKLMMSFPLCSLLAFLPAPL